MTGLIQRNMQSSQQSASTQASPPEESGLPETFDAEAYERYKLAGIKMIFDEKGNQQILELLASHKDAPAKGVADAAFFVVMSLDHSAGGKIPEDMLVPLAADMLEQVMEVAEKSKVVPVTKTTLPQAVQQLVVKAIEAGVIDPAEIQEMAKGMGDDEIKQMVAEQDKIAYGDQGQAVDGEQEAA